MDEVCEYRGLVLRDNQLLIKDDELYLNGCQCIECDHVMFPPKELCFNCMSDQLMIRPIGREATLKNFTSSYVAPEGFQAPLVQALVELEEGPEVFALIEINPEGIHNISNGMKLRLLPWFLKNEIMGWRYQPASEDVG